MKKNVYLPPWQKKLIPPLFAAIWLFTTYQQFFAGAPEMRMSEYLLFTLVFVGAGSVIWRMASGKLPAYVIEEPTPAVGQGEESTSPRTPSKGPQGSAPQQMAEKEARKEKIMALITERGEVRNNDVEALLGVSDASAERYLHELEEEGHITQHGATGKGVVYTAR